MRLELTRRGDYAIRAMVALSHADGIEPTDRIPASRIAATMGIPVRILPSVMSRLVRAGLVDVREGRSGGYLLARPAADIGLLEIVEAIEGDTRRRRCILAGRPCSDATACAVHSAFERAQTSLRTELTRATLADLGPR